MKKVLSLLFALIMALSSLFVSFPAYSADSPLLFSSSLSGKIISATDVYVVKRKNCTPSYTEKKGKRFTLSRGKSFTILGKDKRGGSKVYARLNINKKTYYGYIKRHYIKIIGLKNYDTGTDIKYNSHYKRKMAYPYAVYKDMPFYQFNQTDKKGSINGLRLPYSCGPHSLACVLSALHGDVITPECIMKNMSRRAPNPNGTGSQVSIIAKSVKSYIRDKYNLSYEYKVINPSKSFDYLKKGYIVIAGVENIDRLTLFTASSHYIVLVGYDKAGNVITTNSNLKTGLFESFAPSRIKKNMKNSVFYKNNTLAFKYKYNDSFSAYKTPVSTKVIKANKIYQHRGKMGAITNAPTNKRIKVIGSSGNSYYVSFGKKSNEKFGYISKNCVACTAIVKQNKDELVYNGKNQTPEVSVTNTLGKKLPYNAYKVVYPSESVGIGTYKVEVRYSCDYIGAKSFNFKIVPSAPKIVSKTTNKNSCTVTWKNGFSDEITKYQLEYSLDKHFKSGVKKININKDSTQYSISKLKKSSKYYIRIKSFKTVNGVRYWSPNSNTVTVSTSK